MSGHLHPDRPEMTGFVRSLLKGRTPDVEQALFPDRITSYASDSNTEFCGSHGGRRFLALPRGVARQDARIAHQRRIGPTLWSAGAEQSDDPALALEQWSVDFFASNIQERRRRRLNIIHI